MDSAMQRMAGCDMDLINEVAAHQDEIGQVARAMEVFRGADEARRHAWAEQKVVVEALASREKGS